MARQKINLGTAPDGAGGDDVRGAFTKTNANFEELYTEVPQAEAQAGTASTIRGWTARRIVDAITGWWGRIGKVGSGKVMLEGAGGWLGVGGLAHGTDEFDVGVVKTGSLKFTRNSSGDPFPQFGMSLVFGGREGVGSVNGNWFTQIIKDTTPYSSLQYRSSINGDAWSPFYTVYSTVNTTTTSDGTLKTASPIIKLYKNKHEIENESEFGLTPTVNKISTGVYEIENTLGLRSDSWFLDTPQDRNGNKYFNVDYEQTTGTVVDGVLDAGEIDSLDDLPKLEPSTVIVRCFERVWNPKTGIFENGDPVDIKDGRYITLRFNELQYTIKPTDHESVAKGKK